MNVELVSTSLLGDPPVLWSPLKYNTLCNNDMRTPEDLTLIDFYFLSCLFNDYISALNRYKKKGKVHIFSYFIM
jgi:hypothetical protein